ncbi:MAG TPA: hypothetical protein VFD02_06580 [Syntrophomonadaceae bacterium]|nr:hypothetical protein [Syntrophomonadaceae bacterium]
MTTMITYREQRQIEKERAIARAHCKICKREIGEKPYVIFEERHFHLVCLRKDREHEA